MIWGGEVEVDQAPEVERKPRSVRSKSRETVRMGRKRELVRHRHKQRQVLNPKQGSYDWTPNSPQVLLSNPVPSHARLILA